MGKQVEFELNMAGLNELMKSQEMAAILDTAANQLAASAGNGYEVEKAHALSFDGIAQVYAATDAARKDCRKNNTLLKAAGGIRV